MGLLLQQPVRGAQRDHESAAPQTDVENPPRVFQRRVELPESPHPDRDLTQDPERVAVLEPEELAHGLGNVVVLERAEQDGVDRDEDEKDKRDPTAPRGWNERSPAEGDHQAEDAGHERARLVDVQVDDTARVDREIGGERDRQQPSQRAHQRRSSLRRDLCLDPRSFS